MNILEEIKKETKKVIITIVLLLVMFPTAWSISVLLHASSREILSMLFLVYLFFIAQLWFCKDMDVAKTVNKARIAFLTTATFILLRLIAARLFDLPPLMSVQYYLYLHRKLAVSSTAILQKMLMTYTFDIGLALLVLYYFTYKVGDLLKKLTWFTGLGLVIIVAVIATLQRILPTPTAIIGNNLHQVDPRLGNFFGSLTFWGVMAILAIGVFILGASLPAKKGGSILAPIGFFAIAGFLVFCFVVKVSGGKPLGYFVKPEVLANLGDNSTSAPPKNPPPFSRVRKGNIVIHSFNPGKKIMKSKFTDEFIVLAVDSSESKIFPSVPKNQLIREDLNPTDVIFSRTKNFSKPSDWLSTEEVKTKNCNPGTVYVTVNCINSSIARSRGIGGTINVTYQEKT